MIQRSVGGKIMLVKTAQDPKKTNRRRSSPIPWPAATNPYLDMAGEAADHYARERHLPALLALWPGELLDYSLAGTTEIVARLERALRAERRRGRANHWCYDLNRHAALVSALKGERTFLETIPSGRAQFQSAKGAP
jgi:hypothetical protein